MREHRVDVRHLATVSRSFEGFGQWEGSTDGRRACRHGVDRGVSGCERTQHQQKDQHNDDGVDGSDIAGV